MVKPSRPVSLSVLMAIISVSQIVFAVGLTGYLCFRNGEKAVNKLAAQLQQEATQRITNRLESYLETPQKINKINQILLENGQLDIEDKTVLSRHFRDLLKVFTNIDNIAFANADGNFIAVQYNRLNNVVAQVSDAATDNRMTTYELDAIGNFKRKLKILEEFDPRDRSWYQSTIAAQKPVWHPIFSFFSDRQVLVLSAGSPVYQDEELVGIFNSRLYLSRVSEFLETIEIGDRGEVFIIERSGELVASSVDRDLFLDTKSNDRVLATQANHPLVQATAIYLQQEYNHNLNSIQQSQYLDFRSDRQRQFLQITPFQDNFGIDWLVVVVVPETDFMAEIHDNTRLTILLCAIALIIATITSILLTRRLIHPMFELIAAANSISQGKWQQRVQNSKIKELSLLALTFNRMADQLRDSFTSLEKAEAKYRDIFENALEGIFQSTPEGQFLSVNPALAKMLGYSNPEALIADIRDIKAQLYVNPEDRDRFKQLITQDRVVTNFQSQFYCRDGTVIWISEYARAKCDRDGNILYYEGTVENITQRKAIEAQLQYNANHDELTGLYNRKAFLQRLQDTINAAKLDPEHRFAVLFFDLDDFKLINDSLGHLIGDMLLIAVVDAIQGFLPPHSILARFGGDEFILLLDRLADFEDAIAIARQINITLQSPFQLESHETFASSSIGIVLSRNVNQTPEDFLRDADTALYQAKAKGKGRYELFNRQMHAKIRRRLQLETDLRYALEKNQITIVYQPIIDSYSQKVLGVEALLRWYHPQKGWISPAEFIPIAEETGLIVPLGWWLVEQVCQQNLEWQKYSDRELFISINWSSKQLVQVDLIQKIMAILEANQHSPARLKLEITEGSLLSNTKAILEKLNRLSALGFKLSIDDFGTGYSSLSYLHQFPFNTLKIDRSFVSNLNLNLKNREIVEAIIRLAHHLHLDVVAEGVETPEHFEYLKQLNCEQIQGYLFSPPVSSDRILLILRKESS